MSKETNESLSVFFCKSWIFFLFFLQHYNDTMGQRDWISVQGILLRGGSHFAALIFQVSLSSDPTRKDIMIMMECKLREQSEMWAFFWAET